MASISDRFVAWLKRYWDRVIFVAVIFVLAGSLAYLATSAKRIKEAQKDFDRALERLTPTHPEAEDVDLSRYEASLARLEQMQTPPPWTNLMLVPESRVPCTDCRRPIPVAVAKAREPCPFCDAIPPGPALDSDEDRDLMWDSWETDNGFDPEDPADAGLDPDDDGFANVEEFRFRTDPNDPGSSPLPELLVVSGASRKPFGMVFQSVMILPGDVHKFGINTADMTHFKKLGETVAGYAVEAYDPERPVPGTDGSTGSVAVLTVRNGDQVVELVKGRRKVDYSVEVLFLPDGARHEVAMGGSITVRGKVYEIAALDPRGRTVSLKRAAGEGQWLIGPQPE